MWPLVAMENALFADRSLDWKRRCAAIAGAGFAGVYAVPHPLGDDEWPRLQTLGDEPARCGLRLAGVYANLDLAVPETAPASRRLVRLFAEVASVPRIELSVKWSGREPVPPDWEERLAGRLSALLGIARRRGIRVTLYPHSFYPLETTAQAAWLAPRLGPDQAGYAFATSHVFALHSGEETIALLARHAARIDSFNVCGCRRTAPLPPAKCHHLPFGEGDLDPAPLLEALASGGYRGDVIVQGHGWTGDLPTMLRRCVAAYRRAVRTIPPLCP
jgi:sugar phosphate isomerase/epimerase